MIKIAIVGSRKLLDYDKFEAALYKAVKESTVVDSLDFTDPGYSGTEIVSGGATGVDTLARKFAEKYEIKYKEFPADWTKYGKAAGPIRNQQIAEYSDICIAIYFKELSRGTQNCVSHFKDLGRQVCEIMVDGS